MKKVILLICLMPYLAYGQVVENFEAGNLTDWKHSAEGRWKADTSGSLSGRYSLHHVYDNNDAGTDQTGISIDSLHPSEGTVRWSFKIRHGYDPSSSNNWSVFIMSDAGPESVFTDGNTNGYAIGVNLTGYDDTLRLCKVKGNAVSVVVNCRLNWQSVIGAVNTAVIVVERIIDGTWTVTVSIPEEDPLCISTGKDIELFPCEWFILSYKYSSSRDRLLWLDDLSIDGIFHSDNEVPAIKSCEASDKSHVRISLSDQPDDSFMAVANFSLIPGGRSPSSVLRESAFSYILEFDEEFTNRSTCTLLIKNLCSRNGNCAREIQLPFTPAWPGTGDIIISEIMADPEPEVSLPPKEYIEITNRTAFAFNLNNWKLVSGETTYPFPEVIIKPYAYLILCSAQDTSKFSSYGHVLGLKQFPVLTDNGKILLLSDPDGRLIHGVEYSSDWYNDELKSGGGWALEMIDAGYPFFYSGNWSASRSGIGGTPGRANSVKAENPDNIFSGDLIIFPLDSLKILITSPEPVFDFANMTDSIRFDVNRPLSITSIDPLFRSFSAVLSNPLARRTIYGFELKGDIEDFAGNKLRQRNFSFGLTEPAGPGDILFNELLFNAWPGDPDYLEFYNSSEKILDASRLGLVSVNDASGDTSQICMVSDLHKCILPDEYYAITTDREKILSRYFSADAGSLFQVASLPSMPDDKGHLVLLSRELLKIDEVSYTEKMQSPLLSGYDGVALEKVNMTAFPGDAGNWHSASGTSGWGTPGAPNSVYSKTTPSDNIVSLSSSRISPDDDGFEDLLTINFNLKGNSNVVSVTIFNETGNYVRKVAENMYAGPEASLIWDGTAEDGTMVDTGIYIVFITLFDESGKTNKWKKVCTVIRR
jgi:hypothetical protein